ncbi:hypothetical protein STRCI_000045 [Streptomyces cinnabarinus]|uniref:Uncharacterized protein n=1 Tax=Streptomyces cinnabarinus TaxID=67287 RepID=A0ABY7K814_9ACTN|nr:hypothetical protein [Streptomyces cinnabarinus]WAZ19026.1 hypothetical protein STRCI_000045 [Streptomyces cinnabarinus]
MALVKKGSRRITVDGVSYRWRIRRKPTYSQALAWSPLTYAVELADSPGSTLVVTTNQAHPDNWMLVPPSAVVPSAVAEGIRCARSLGWAPKSTGSPFHLDQSDGFVSPH